MFASIDQGVRAWVAGLAEAVLRAGDRLRAPVQLMCRSTGPGRWEIRRGPAEAEPVGRIAGVERAFPAAADLAGARVLAEIPADWVLVRRLDPVPVKSLPYLDGFVRHHIERVTPWRVGDTYYATMTQPLEGERERMAVSIAVVPRSLLVDLVAALTPLAPRQLRLMAPATATQVAVSIEVPVAGGEADRRRRAVRWVGAVLAVVVIGLVAAIGVAGWWQVALETEQADLDRLIDEKRRILKAATLKAGQKVSSLSRPEQEKATLIPVVALIDELSSVLPDHAFLSDIRLEGRKIRLTGTSRDVAGLIPVIERSGSFTEVSFFAPTTRQANQAGDRFYIEARVRPAPGEVAR